MYVRCCCRVVSPSADALLTFSSNHTTPRHQVLLARPEFASLATAPAVAAKLAPLTLAQHLHAPFDAMARYAAQLQALIELTPEGEAGRARLLVRMCVLCLPAFSMQSLHSTHLFTQTGGPRPGAGHQGADGQDAGGGAHVPSHPGRHQARTHA